MNRSLERQMRWTENRLANFWYNRRREASFRTGAHDRMTEADFKAGTWRLGADYRDTFAALYSRPDERAEIAKALADAGFGDAVCVDAARWIRDVAADGTPATWDTVRALHANDADVIALEFMADTRNAAHRMRRVYNLFFALVQNAVATFADVRSRLVYAVVLDTGRRRKGTSSEATDTLTTSLTSLVNDPWEYEMSEIANVNAKCDERRLSGLVCKKAYLLYESELRSFAKSKGVLS